MWVESLRSDPGNIVSKQTADIYKLQNKARLHDVLTAYSYGTLLPKLFRNPQEIAPTQYPVVLKRSVGASGYGIFIINSAKELAKEMDISNINSNKNERIAPYQARNSVGWIIEEAVVGGLEYMVHYIRTNSGRPFIKCTVYKKEKWQSAKLVKGTFDKRPIPSRTKCNMKVVCMVLHVIEIEGIVGAGCVGFKIDERTNAPKVFDWNMRQCGSQTPVALKGMLTDPRNWTRIREKKCRRPVA